VTLALAIIGTVSGVIALAVTLRREWLDRARLAITADPMSYPDGRGFIVTTVDNHGRQPVTIKRIGLETNIEEGQLAADHRQEVLMNDPWSRERIEPGGHAQLFWDTGYRLPCHADTPFRAFADYGARKRVWGKPFLYYRALLLMGWKPENGAESLTRRMPGVPAKAVEPWWKWWKPGHTRKDTVPDELPFLNSALIEALRAGEAAANTGAEPQSQSRPGSS
jgi:hypothetical protein